MRHLHANGISIARRLLILAPLIAVLNSRSLPQQQKPKPLPKVTHMANSDSRSLIIRASHIFLLKIEGAEIGQWKVLGNGTKERTADLKLRLEQTLKGEVQERPGDNFQLPIKQTGRVVSRFFAVPGVWSDQTIDHGAEHVAFCISTSNSVKEVLKEPALTRIYPAAKALADVRLAMKAQTENLSIARLLRMIAAEKPSLNALFGDYISTRLGEILFANPEDFDVLMGFVEDPQLSAVTRTVLFENIYASIVDATEAPPSFPSRLVVSGCRLLQLPEAATIHSNLLDDYLPSLLGTNEPAPRLTADQVFRNYPLDREKIEKSLAADSKGGNDTTKILRWLREHHK